MSDQQRERRDIERRRQNAKKPSSKEALPSRDFQPRKPTKVYERELQVTWCGSQPQHAAHVRYSESVDRCHAMPAFKDVFLQMLKENTFIFERCLFRFDDTLQTFTKVNGLVLTEAPAVFVKASSVAIERREMALKRLERSRISINRRHLGNGDYEHEYHLLGFEWTDLFLLDRVESAQISSPVFIKRFRTQ